MNIYIHQNNENDFSVLKDICFKFLLKKNIEAEISAYSAIKNSSAPENTGIFLIEYDENIKSSAKHIYSANYSHYIVIVTDSIGGIGSDIFPSVRPSGFIMKPFERDAVENILKEIYSNFSEINQPKDVIFSFKIRSQEFRIPFSSILYFESSNKKIKIRTAAQEFETYLTLDKVESIMPDNFTRVHKGFIVNTDIIDSIDYKNMTVILKCGSMIPVSRNFKGSLKEKVSEGSKRCL